VLLQVSTSLVHPQISTITAGAEARPHTWHSALSASWRRFANVQHNAAGALLLFFVGLPARLYHHQKLPRDKTQNALSPHRVEFVRYAAYSSSLTLLLRQQVFSTPPTAKPINIHPNSLPPSGSGGNCIRWTRCESLTDIPSLGSRHSEHL
jgi:hypothetical protein